MKDDITVSEAPLDIPSPPQRQPVTPYKLRRAAGEAELSPVARLLAEYMVVGTNHPRAKRLDLPIGEPLSLEQAAAVLDIKRRNARQIFRLTQFRKLFASMIADVRSGAHARMVRNMICIANNPGDGAAADRSVQLRAAQAVLGEDAKGFNVNVQLHNETHIAVRPGYVLRLPPGLPSPHALTAEPDE